MTKIEIMQSQDSDEAKVDMAFDKLITYIKEYTQEEVESVLDELKNKYTDNTDKHTPDVRVMKQSPFMPSFMPVQNIMVNSIVEDTKTEEAKHDGNESEEYNDVYKPSHYCSHGIETTEKIEHVIDGLPAKQAAMLFNVLKYFDRAGFKNDAEQDLDKANNYAHRLITGHWRNR